MRVFYFGAIDRPGHYLWQPGRNGVKSVPGPEADTLGWGWCAGKLDGRYPPARRRAPDKRGYCMVLAEATQGAAALHHETRNDVEWTILAFWDRSVDTRGGCSSTYLLEGTHDYPTAVKLAKEHFPTVWARYTFHVHLYPGGEL